MGATHGKKNEKDKDPEGVHQCRTREIMIGRPLQGRWEKEGQRPLGLKIPRHAGLPKVRPLGAKCGTGYAGAIG